MPGSPSIWSATCSCSRPAASSRADLPNRSPPTRRSGARTSDNELIMQAFFHQLLSGLANGAIYASVALALVMIFKATHHVNFAQGELAMFSTYVAYTLVQAGVPYWGAFVITLL